jgi:hypothetical protein
MWTATNGGVRTNKHCRYTPLRYLVPSFKLSTIFGLLLCIVIIISSYWVAAIPVLAASATLTPEEGYAGTSIHVNCLGLEKGASGWSWFDTDDDDIKDTGEPQESIITTGAGAIPTGITLLAPETPSNSYFVHADIPESSPIEATAGFTVNPGIILSPAYGLMNTAVTINTTGGGFAVISSSVPWLNRKPAAISNRQPV